MQSVEFNHISWIIYSFQLYPITITKRKHLLVFFFLEKYRKIFLKTDATILDIPFSGLKMITDEYP